MAQWEEENTQSGVGLNEERNGRSHINGDNTNCGRSRSRSPSRIKSLIASLYTPMERVGKVLKSALVTSAQTCHKNLKGDEQCEERKGHVHELSMSLCRSRIKTLIGSLCTPIKCVAKGLKNAAITSAQIYCYTSASYYHFLLHLLGSASPLPPKTLIEINELVLLNVNGGPGTPADYETCSACEEEIQLNHEMGRILPCRHRSHGHCISKLLEDCNYCPLCRFILHDADATMSLNQNHGDE